MLLGALWMPNKIVADNILIFIGKLQKEKKYQNVICNVALCMLSSLWKQLLYTSIDFHKKLGLHIAHNDY